MTPLFRKLLGHNWLLFLTMTGLLVFGICAIYSASAMRTGDHSYLAGYYKRQIAWVLGGFLIYFGTSLTDYRWVRWGALPFYLTGIAGLIAVRFLGQVKSGARSWIEVAGFSVQPSQVAIVGGIIALAVALGELRRLHPVFEKPFLRLGLTAALVLTPLFLIILEPDVGSAFVWIPTVASILLLARIPLRYLFVITLLGVNLFPWAYVFGLDDYQRLRINVFQAYREGQPILEQEEGWDTRLFLVTVASGGVEGKGYLGSRIKAGNPEVQTLTETGLLSPRVQINDYIFAVIAEQFGFRGCLLVISAFCLLLMLCLYVGFYSRDETGRLIVVGAVGMLFVHIFLNIGMTVLLVPVTGLPLPLVSYGGTFAVTCMFLLGMVQSVWVHRRSGEAVAEDSIFYSPQDGKLLASPRRQFT
jgi:rod shape determining protein RodA